MLGQTELAQAIQIDTLLGSVVHGVEPSGGYCAASRAVVGLQWINSTTFVFSAAVPALPTISASEGINNPSEHVVNPRHAAGEDLRGTFVVLDLVEAVTIPSRRLADPSTPGFVRRRCPHVRLLCPVNPRNPCGARCTTVRYRGVETPAAGHSGIGARRVCGSLVHAGCVGTSLSRGARASALPSRRRCGSWCVSAPLASPRLSSQRCS